MKLKEYLYNQFASSFFPIFFGLYFITSIVFLVKIAALTSVINIDIFELLRLYMYVIPSILLYTLPVTFFISMTITLSKLSSEYELIVITSLGLNPVKILKVFFPITLFITISLLVISLGLIPKAQYENDTFLEKKKGEANFNIKASEFGQSFGDWHIFIDKKEDKNYYDIKLLKTDDTQEQFILAKKALLENKDGNLSFKLLDGKSFHIQDKEFNQINYADMIIYNNIKNKDGIKNFTDSYNYWKSNLKRNEHVDKFSYYVLFSLFPLVSLFLVVVYGYYNPRYEKSRAVQYSALFIVIYYSLTSFLSKSLLLNSIYIIPIAWIIVSYFLYTRSVKKQY